jgi:ribosomal protein S12 methylthiotransferase accessory factor
MLHHPRFKPHWRAEVVKGEGLFLLSDARQTLLQGRLYELVAPCLDGRSVDAICDQLRGQTSPAEIYYTLAQLERKGYLADGEPSLPAGEAAFWSAQGADPEEAARRLADTPVALTALGAVDPQPLRDLLQGLHVRVADEGALGLVLADDYLREELRAYNREALGSGRPWLLVRPFGSWLWVGPLFRPGKTGCWECLAQRLRANQPMESYLGSKNGHAGAVAVPRGHTSASLHIAWGLAANAVASWVIRGELPALEGKVQTLSLLSWKTEAHTLVRRPHCRACGQRPEPAARPVVLESRRKVFTQEGGHRTITPEETVQLYGHHVSPITGAVSVLERCAPAGDGIMHVYDAGRNYARQPENLNHLRHDLRSGSSGKGTCDAQARASGLCEGLERYSAVYHGDEPRRPARFVDLGDDAIHPNACMLFSDRQYRERDAWNARSSRYNWVPLPFDPEATIDWTPIWSLTRNRPCYLPTSYCYFQCPYPLEQAYCASCSNGNAAGNTLEEAILQGFLELVERDSVALWWYNRARRPGVDLDSFEDPYLGRLRAFLKKRGRDLWALDLTADLNIPAYVALSRRTDGPEEQILFGLGAHLDPRLALLRAVTEMNQMLSTVLREPHEDVPVEKLFTDRETVAWLKTATLANQPYLVPVDGPPRTAAAHPRPGTDDLREDVLACQALVEGQGMEMLVLDQTRPDIGLPVVKVFVPGLRHFWARFASGRLYDVPVQLGWLPGPLAEDQLNPIPMFL